MEVSDFRALVVDDEPALRQLIVLALGRRGVRCDQAENGHEALKNLERANYDVVISDLAMPVMSGDALATAVLARKDRPMLIIVTGDIEPRRVQDLLNRGVDDIVFKPIDFHGFAGRIKVLLDRQLASHRPLSKERTTTGKRTAASARL
jgi:DNA-binding response OmpR family regulator